MTRHAPLALAILAALILGPPAAAAPDPAIHAWRQAHEKQILADYFDFLALPNVATNLGDVKANAAVIDAKLKARGFATRLLSDGPDAPPVVYGEFKVPGAKRTVVFYAHYDGQPVDQPEWITKPFQPVVRSAGVAGSSHDIDWRSADTLDPDWRIYGRSASDDKATIQAMFSALDALKATGKRPKVNVKVLYEGEEEMGSGHLDAVLKANKVLLQSDLLVVGDGPAHQTGPAQVTFGARGTSSVELTVYGPSRPLHDGHYGNWAPNPAAMLVRLLAGMRDDEGGILIPGWDDDVTPLTSAERAAVDAMPPVEADLMRDLHLGRSEGNGARLADTLQHPALNIRGLRAGNVGDAAANAISTKAEASIDFRLVPGETPQSVRDRFEAYVRGQGWTIFDHEPTPVERAAHARVIKLAWSMGYAAERTSLNEPAARTFAAAVERAVVGPIVRMPMMGGSVPMSTFADDLKTPVVGLAFVNPDNNQHAANENLRLSNLWSGIEIYAGILAGLDW